MSKEIMSIETRKQSKYPAKSILSKKSQELLEKIFSFFDNEEAAKNDPDFCLETMFIEIYEEFLRHQKMSKRLHGDLYFMLCGGCSKEAIECAREERDEAEMEKTLMKY